MQDGRRRSATPALPSQGLPRQGHVVSTRWPSAPSPRPSQPGQQHPLVFTFEPKKPPPVPATASAPRPAAADAGPLPTPTPVTAQAAAEANPWGFLEKRSKPGHAQLAAFLATPSGHGSFAPTAQQSPRRENHQQHSETPLLLPSPLVPSWLPVTAPEGSRGATGASVSPPCLEIISLKEGLVITTFPRLNQSRPPKASVPVRAGAQPLTGAARRDPPEMPDAHGGMATGSGQSTQVCALGKAASDHGI